MHTSLRARFGRSLRLAVVAAALASSSLLVARPLHAQCVTDAQGADDEPGQKDLSQYCLAGTCGAGLLPVGWGFDDTNWPGSNTGDACALFDTDGDTNADRAVCVSVEDAAQMQAGNPKCYTCGDTRPDRCTSGALVACTSACSVALASDPFQLVPAHIGSACNGTNCRTLDAHASCCVTAGDRGGGVLVDVCSYPSQQPNSNPSDCISSTDCNKNDPNDPACNDGNPCTMDTCDATDGICRHAAGNAGASCRAAAGPCDVAEVCTGSSGTCPADAFAMGGVCRNASDLCDVAESCDGTSAQCPADGVAASGVLCRTASGVCDVAEVCDGASKACPANGSQPSNVPCDDGNACTTADHCDGAGGCTGGPAPDCDDGNGCTDDGCDPQTGCTHVGNAAPCDDGDACTTADACAGGACVGGPAPDCNDGDVCTDDGCDPQTGCTHASNTAPCDDGNACTTGDACAGGACAGGPATDCDDANACTTDSCDPGTGCQHAAVPGCCNTDAECADADQCTTNERCVANACTSDPVACDDGNPCTDDGCDPQTGCTHVLNAVPCDDGNACTSGDACAGGACAGVPVACGDGDVCTDDSCDPQTGCVHTHNTAPCSDGSLCTTGDACLNGACVGGPAPDCDDADPCTDDSCAPGTGCVHANNTAPCSDGNPCTENDACAAGLCAPGPQKDCNDLNGCTDDTCNPQTGVCEHAANAAPCDDGNVCTTGDLCVQGGCQPGSPKDCGDGNACTADTCTPTTDCQHAPIAGCCLTDADCVDTDECTTNERCVANACVSDPRDCDDADPCTVDTCDNSGGGFLCEHAPCFLVQGQPCPDPICVPAPCGDGIVDAQEGETCDPPGSATSKPGVLCRADCTFCGDGLVQPTGGETCDDGNAVEGCVKNRSFPADDCQNNCTPHICRDPTTAVLSQYIDRFTFHGQLTVTADRDFASRSFAVQLLAPDGRVIYRTSVPAGEIASRTGTAAGPYRYTNPAAKRSGGIAKIRIQRIANAYRTTVVGYGNLLGSQADMTTHVYSGETRWTVGGEWERRGPRRWRFIQP